jgi:hypothetical protein
MPSVSQKLMWLWSRRTDPSKYRYFIPNTWVGEEIREGPRGWEKMALMSSILSSAYPILASFLLPVYGVGAYLGENGK